MIIQNTKNYQKDIPAEFQKYAFGQNTTGKLPLTIDKKYVVSAVKTVNGTQFYLIIADDGELQASPWWFPADLFQVTDDWTPDDWVAADEGNTFKITGFDEIVNDSEGRFYNSLEDGEEDALNMFLKHYEEYAKHHNMWYVDGKSTR